MEVIPLDLIDPDAFTRWVVRVQQERARWQVPQLRHTCALVRWRELVKTSVHNVIPFS